VTQRRPITLADMDRVAQQRPPIDDRAVHDVPLADIAASPRNPRAVDAAVDELAASLEAHGLLQPILVRRVLAGDPGGYEIIAGHRRFTAAKHLGWPTIACVIRDAEEDEAFVLTLVENLQRDDLSAKEEAAGLETLLREREWSVRQVAEAVKRDPSFVSRRLRVFDDPQLAPFVLRNQVPVAVAEELLPLPPDDRATLIRQVAAGQWSRAVTRRAVAAVLQPHLGRRPRSLTTQIRALRKTLEALQPIDLTDLDRKELLQLFKVGQFLGRRKPRVGPPVMPTIAPSGRVFVAEEAEAEAP